MDENDPVLSQQTQVVSKLLVHYSEVTVITGRIGKYRKSSNLTVISSDWIIGKNLKNALRFLQITIPILVKYRPQVIFSHMTEVQSFLISLITYFFRIKHYLWYAHTSKSFFLRWNHVFLSGIITSTPGSCPIVGAKVYPIGQAVDRDQFLFRDSNTPNLDKLVHVGRFDRSKNVSLIISEVETARKKFPELTLTLIGSPSNSKEEEYAKSVKTGSKNAVTDGWIVFKSSISRNEIPGMLYQNDIFIHAFQGSLDKTLVEATMVGLPVVTINHEYHNEFGIWDKESNIQTSLMKQIIFIKNLPSEKLVSELRIRREIAIKRHSLEKWIEKLVAVLA